MARYTLGIAARDGIVYTLYANDTVTYMYRQNAETLAVLDSNPWLDSTGVLLAWVVPPSVSYNSFMAIGKDKIGIISQDGTNGIRLRIITRSTGATSSTTVISATTTLHVCDICADDSDNFYVVWATSTTAFNRLQKFNSSGTSQWTLTGSTRIYGCAYDRIRSKLQIVGEALGGGANTVADIDPADGSLDDGAAVSSANWFSIRADGRMGWLIGKADTVARITGDGEYTLTWTRTVTGFSGYQLGAADGSNGVQFLQPSNRITRLVAISVGDVACFDRFGLIPVTSGANAYSDLRPVMFAAQNGARLYIVDGVQTKRYNPLTNTIESWTAAAGTFPVGTATDYPRLIETWRGRTVLAGVPTDPDNWWMTRQNDATDFNTSAQDDQAAIAGNNAEGLGRVPDIINCIIAYSDDLLIFGCDHSIHRVTGDPRRGGSMDLLSDTIGMAWGRPFCRDALGTIYFFSSRCRVYRMTPHGAIQHISAGIDNILQNVDLLNTVVRMAWDDEEQGFYLLLTPMNTTKATRHFWYDATRQAWFPDRFTKAGHNPRVVYLYDGDEANDRRLLIGCNDGYVRYFESQAADDDKEAIWSHCYLGPLLNPGGGVLLKSIEGTLANDTGSVSWSVHVGESVERALRSKASATGKLPHGRSRVQPARRHGHAMFIKLSNRDAHNRWAVEKLEAVLQGTGRVRGRAF